MGGLILPLLLPVFIKAWGTAVTLRILSFVVIVSLLPVLPFIRGRLPETRTRGPAARRSGQSWARSPLFWTLVVVNTLQGFAYFVPIVWLPSTFDRLCGEWMALMEDYSLRYLDESG
jgi:MFS transporter, MCT family, solute carrier family 16 (monocarboxylic acid transporters), member 10